MTQPTLTYWVSTLRVRRELVPVYEDDRLTAYRCITHRADGPEAGDTTVADQVEFEEELIRLKLMPPRNALKLIYAGFWRGLGLDRLMVTRPPEGQPVETLLRVLAH